MSEKGMKGKDYFSLAFGSMIGIGWVVSAPLWIANAGSIGALIAMGITALIVIPVGFVYSELCTTLKIKGGEFAYTHQLLGRLPGFTSGWFLILGYLTILPWVAVSVSSMIGYAIPAIQSIPMYSILDNTMYLPETVIGLSMIWILTFVNMRGVQASKKFQNVATALLLLTFVIFFIGCFVTGNTENLKPHFSEKGSLQGILMAIASMLFFMNGFDTIPKATDEADKSINAKNLAKALVGTILLGSVIYMFVILASSLVMVQGDVVNLGNLPLVAAYEEATGSKLLVYIMIFGTIMGVTTTFNGFLLAGSKLLASFASSGFMSKSFGKLSGNNVPKKALLFMALFSSAGMFLGKGLLAPLITMGGIAFLVAWFLMACSTLKFRNTQPSLDRPFRIPGGKVMIWIAMIICAALIIMMIVPGTLISLGIVENLLLASWTVLGIILYLSYKKQPIEIKEIK